MEEDEEVNAVLKAARYLIVRGMRIRLVAGINARS